jgi:hypothetical protein
MKQLFIAWVAYQRRSVSMQPHFGYELEFLTFAFKNRWLRPLEYLFKAWQTWALFFRSRPQVIWVQLPPTPILHLAYLYKILFDRSVQLIADCHNATFRSPWITLPGVRSLLNHCDMLIVHNTWVEEQAKSLNLDASRLFVLEDPPATVQCPDDRDQTAYSRPWFVFPCSFNRDEPIEMVLQAARLLPNMTFVLTGNPSRARGIHDLSNIPANVKLTGFLPEGEFDRLLCSADAILGLTQLEGIQLSVANEALGIGQPMILSDTQTLKTLFYKGAVYVNSSSPEAIATGCQTVLTEKQALIQQVYELRQERTQGWLNKSEEIIDILTGLKPR